LHLGGGRSLCDQVYEILDGVRADAFQFPVFAGTTAADRLTGVRERQSQRRPHHSRTGADRDMIAPDWSVLPVDVRGVEAQLDVFSCCSTLEVIDISG
jgi:hypothetical protein